MRWLEHRIPPPITALITAAIMWVIARTTYVASVDQTLRCVATALLSIAGVSIVLLAMFKFRQASTTINPVEIERATSLVTDGIFQLTRNPMYLGLCALLIAFAVRLSAPFALLGIVAFVWFTSRFQIQPEERAMRKLFGNAFDEYCRRTRRWI